MKIPKVKAKDLIEKDFDRSCYKFNNYFITETRPSLNKSKSAQASHLNTSKQSSRTASRTSESFYKPSKSINQSISGPTKGLIRPKSAQVMKKPSSKSTNDLSDFKLALDASENQIVNKFFPYWLKKSESFKKTVDNYLSNRFDIVHFIGRTDKTKRDIDEFVKWCRNIQELEHLPDDIMAKFAFIIQAKKYEKDSFIYNESIDEIQNDLLVLIDGKLGVYEGIFNESQIALDSSRDSAIINGQIIEYLNYYQSIRYPRRKNISYRCTTDCVLIRLRDEFYTKVLNNFKYSDKDRLVDFIRGVNGFNHIDPYHVREMVSSSKFEPVDCDADDVVFTWGQREYDKVQSAASESANYVYIVYDGEFVLYKSLEFLDFTNYPIDKREWKLEASQKYTEYQVQKFGPRSIFNTECIFDTNYTSFRSTVFAKCLKKGSLLRINTHILKDVIKEEIMHFQRYNIKLLIDDRNLHYEIQWYNKVNNVYKETAMSSMGYNKSIVQNNKNLGRKTNFEFGLDKSLNSLDKSLDKLNRYMGKLQSKEEMAYMSHERVKVVTRRLDNDEMMKQYKNRSDMEAMRKMKSAFNNFNIKDSYANLYILNTNKN